MPERNGKSCACVGRESSLGCGLVRDGGGGYHGDRAGIGATVLPGCTQCIRRALRSAAQMPSSRYPIAAPVAAPVAVRLLSGSRLIRLLGRLPGRLPGSPAGAGPDFGARERKSAAAEDCGAAARCRVVHGRALRVERPAADFAGNRPHRHRRAQAVVGGWRASRANLGGANVGANVVDAKLDGVVPWGNCASAETGCEPKTAGP
jgi:hypothetical protein